MFCFCKIVSKFIMDSSTFLRCTICDTFLIVFYYQAYYTVNSKLKYLFFLTIKFYTLQKIFPYYYRECGCINKRITNVTSKFRYFCIVIQIVDKFFFQTNIFCLNSTYSTGFPQVCRNFALQCSEIF